MRFQKFINLTDTNDRDCKINPASIVAITEGQDYGSGAAHTSVWVVGGGAIAVKESQQEVLRKIESI